MSNHINACRERIRQEHEAELERQELQYEAEIERMEQRHQEEIERQVRPTVVFQNCTFIQVNHITKDLESSADSFLKFVKPFVVQNKNEKNLKEMVLKHAKTSDNQNVRAMASMLSKKKPAEHLKKVNEEVKNLEEKDFEEVKDTVTDICDHINEELNILLKELEDVLNPN